MRIAAYAIALLAITSCLACEWAGGATFPVPIYESVWQDLHPDTSFPYSSVGSQDGVRSFLKGKFSMAGSDWPLTADEESRLIPASRLTNVPEHIYIPTIVGAVVPIYNLAGVSAPLAFTAEALAGIYQGTIRTWDAVGGNGGVTLPKRQISVVCRLDGSGSTYIWTEFLSLRTTIWKPKPGLEVDWPRCNQRARGSQGMIDTVLATPDSIGYVEFTYAVRNLTGTVSYGQVQNKAKDFVAPDVDSIAAATLSVDKRLGNASFSAADLPRQSEIALLETDEKDAYPVSAATWLIVPIRPNPVHAGDITQFLDCITSPKVQQKSKQNIYAPLPKVLVDLAHSQIGKLQVPSTSRPACP